MQPEFPVEVGSRHRTGVSMSPGGASLASFISMVEVLYTVLYLLHRRLKGGGKPSQVLGRKCL